MLDAEVATIVRQKIEVLTKYQHRDVSVAIVALKAQLAARGLSRSSGAVVQAAQACREALKTFSADSWGIHFRVLTQSGVSFSDSLAGDLKKSMAVYISERCQSLSQLLIAEAQKAGMNDATTAGVVNSELEVVRELEKQLIESEIDLFVLSLKNKEKERSEGRTSTVFNQYGPIGAVQTGAQSVANVVQSVDLTGKAELLRALDAVEKEVAAEPDAELRQKLAALSSEAKQELAKSSPDPAKLEKYVARLGIVVTGADHLKHLYQLVRAGARAAGIELP